MCVAVVFIGFLFLSWFFSSQKNKIMKIKINHNETKLANITITSNRDISFLVHVQYTIHYYICHLFSINLHPKIILQQINERSFWLPKSNLFWKKELLRRLACEFDSSCQFGVGRLDNFSNLCWNCFNRPGNFRV